MTKGIRGATQVDADRPESILSATRELLSTIAEINAVTSQDVVACFFTTTPDLTAQFPALAARQFGWVDVPLLGSTEMAVPSAPERILRVLLLVEWSEDRPAPQHVYLKGAVVLRPDLQQGGRAR